MAKLGAKSIVNGLEFEVLSTLSRSDLIALTLEGHDGLSAVIKVKSGDLLKIIDEPQIRSKDNGSLIVGWTNVRTKETGYSYWYWFKECTEHIPNAVTPKSNKKEIKVLSTGPLDGLEIKLEEVYIDNSDWLPTDRYNEMRLKFIFPGKFSGAKWISDKMLKQMKKNPYFKQKIMEEAKSQLEEAEKTHTFFQSRISNSDAKFLGKDGAHYRVGTDLTSGEFWVHLAMLNDAADTLKYLELYLDYLIAARGLPSLMEE